MAPVSISAAYSATGAAWQRGPGRIYDHLAEVLVAASPIARAGRRVLDVGAGTGAASRAIAGVGGRAIAVDLAEGMLRTDRAQRAPAAVADARRLPVATGSCGAVVAAFSYNHVPDPHGISVRVVVGRDIRDAGRVEDHEVRPRADADLATVAEAQMPRRERGHLPNRVLEREDSLVAHVASEHAREGPVRARVRLSK